MSKVNHMDAVPAAGNVNEGIASIETKRQAMEKRSGLAAACSSALSQLHELLGHEKEVLRACGEVGIRENVEAVRAEIGRVERLTLITGQGPVQKKNAYPAGLRRASRQKSWQDAQRSPARNKGRRTMGRAGGR